MGILRCIIEVVVFYIITLGVILFMHKGLEMPKHLAMHLAVNSTVGCLLSIAIGYTANVIVKNNTNYMIAAYCIWLSIEAIRMVYF